MNWLLFLQGSPWWEFVIAIIAALLGALAGGVPSYLLAVKASRDAANKENEILRSQERSKATRIFLEFQDLLNEAVNDLLMMEEMLAPLKISAEVEPYRIQRRLRPLANLDYLEYSRFSPDDLSLLFSREKGHVAQELLILSKRYNAILNSLRTYRDLKSGSFPILINLPEHDIGKDGKVVSKVDTQTLSKVRLTEAQAESVIAPTLKGLRELVDESLDLASTLGGHLIDVLKNEKRFLSFDEQDLDRQRKSVAEAREGLEYITEIGLGN